MAQDEIGHARASTRCCRISPEVRADRTGNAYAVRARAGSRRPLQGWTDFVAANFLIDTALSVLLESARASSVLSRSDNVLGASWRKNVSIGSTPRVGPGAWRLHNPCHEDRTVRFDVRSHTWLLIHSRCGRKRVGRAKVLDAPASKLIDRFAIGLIPYCSRPASRRYERRTILRQSNARHCGSLQTELSSSFGTAVVDRSILLSSLRHAVRTSRGDDVLDDVARATREDRHYRRNKPAQFLIPEFSLSCHVALRSLIAIVAVLGAVLSSS